jgi:hypothetical protein
MYQAGALSNVLGFLGEEHVVTMGRLYKRTHLVAISLVATVMSICSVLGVAALAEACPAETEHVRKVEPNAVYLPECRAYEQVSPVAKNTTDAIGKPGFVESSPSGDSVSYYSIVPFPSAAGATQFPSYLSTRTESGWSTQGLLPLTESYASAEILGLINDNNETVVYVTEENGLLLAPGATAGPAGNLYLRDNLTGAYRLIAASVFNVKFAGATPDGSRVLFSAVLAKSQELGGVADPNHVPYVFEWDRETGQASLVGLVGGSAPQGGGVAGPNESEELGGAEKAYDQNALSEDGSRVFFSELGEGEKVYMREPGTNRMVEISNGEAQWRAATPTGSKVFYTEGGKLYLYDVDTETRTPIAAGSAGVLGVVGISQDGSDAYFVATGVLASNKNGEGDEATAGKDNLYEWHEGAGTPISFIATLNSFYDNTNWEGFTHDQAGAPDEGYKASRVSADGTKVLIGSANQLTEYDNAGESEIYLYDATEPLSPTNPRCVSCNPTGAPAKTGSYLAHISEAGPEVHFVLTTRNLSGEGTRVFFQTAEALLPQATDGQENVYEWEREGAGSCGVGEGVENGGCLYLISTGESTSASYFGDASEDGGDVFFFTRQSLVSQDQDDNADIYDAREGGGLESQNTVSASTCEGEGCRGTSGSGPVFGTPASVTVSGAGNLVPPPPAQVLEPKERIKKAKPRTREQKLEGALRACMKKPSGQRARCKAQAEKKYGSKAKKSNRGGK